MRHSILAEILSREPPEVLYHYTTQAGLLGIIKCKEIWATHTQYLNDRREYLHAVDLVRQEIEVVSAIDDASKLALDEMTEGLAGIESMNVCVCSFSEVKDSLSQWRAYGGGTSGFAIGLSGKFLANVVNAQHFYLVPCLYTPKDQARLVKALVEEVLLENVERGGQSEKHHLPPGGNLCAYLHRYAPILKDAAFAEEKEWRVISGPLSCKFERFDYRQGNSILIPYYRLPLTDVKGRLEVHEVVVGPTPHAAQSQASVRSFLVSQELRDTLVNVSTVPYRNW